MKPRQEDNIRQLINDRALVWVTENKTGISAGICESAANPHATYHADGTYHHKLRQRGKVLTLGATKKVPLASIAPKQQLFGTATFFANDTMSLSPTFTPDCRADTVVVLSQSVFSDIKCAAFNSYIFSQNHEADFIREAYEHYENDTFMLVTVNVFRLDIFSLHKVGVIIYKGRYGPF